MDIHQDIAKMLLELLGTRTSGYVFCTSNGTPLSYGNIRKNVLDKILYDVDRPIMKREGKGWKQIGVNKVLGVIGPPATEGHGFHSFRRFRITYLQTDAETPEAYVKYWAGHGKKIYEGQAEHDEASETLRADGIGICSAEASKVVAVNYGQIAEALCMREINHVWNKLGHIGLYFILQTSSENGQRFSNGTKP